MKLNSALVERTLDQFRAQALPEDHPAMEQLYKLFGMHTFFVDDEGLSIVEPTQQGDGGRRTATVVKLASWTDGAHSRLTPHEPEPTETVVLLGDN